MFSVCCLKVPKNPDLGADAERVRKEEQGKIDESEHISEEEIAEKEGLLKKVRQIVSFLCLHVRILLYKVLYTLVYLCHSFFFFFFQYCWKRSSFVLQANVSSFQSTISPL